MSSVIIVGLIIIVYQIGKIIKLLENLQPLTKSGGKTK